AATFAIRARQSALASISAGAAILRVVGQHDALIAAYGGCGVGTLAASVDTGLPVGAGIVARPAVQWVLTGVDATGVTLRQPCSTSALPALAGLRDVASLIPCPAVPGLALSIDATRPAAHGLTRARVGVCDALPESADLSWAAHVLAAAAVLR